MRLNAIDTDELKIISTVLKDGLIEVSDVKYLPSIRSFVAMITRFMWEEQAINKVNLRTKAVLFFEEVMSVTSKNIDQTDQKNVLELLDFNYFTNNDKNLEIELLEDPILGRGVPLLLFALGYLNTWKQNLLIKKINR